MTSFVRPAAIIDRHGGFASRIAARHAGGIAAPSAIARRSRRSGGLGLVVLRTSPAVRVSPAVRTRFALHLAPRFSFLSQSRLVREWRVTPAAAPAAAARPTAGTAAPTVAMVRRTLQLLTQREQVNARASAASVRDLAGAARAAAPAAVVTVQKTASRSPMTSAMRRETAVQPLARSVVRNADRPLAAAIRQLETAVHSLSNRPASDVVPPPRAAAPSAAPAYPDTAAIADQVLRTLDHRVIALRERMGRS
jgi:hypothetical protein